jgi:extracellular solute-binding protein family 1
LPSKCASFDQYGNLAGKSVNVYTPIVSPEDQSQIDSFKPFEECTGVKINYEGSREFETQLPIKIEAGAPPDIAYLPQPGLLRTLIARFPGKIKEVQGQALANTDSNYRGFWKEYGSVGGKTYAVPVGASAKSFVWYSPRAFAENGYQVPRTWEELIALTQKIADDHPDAKPWCAGIQASNGTGWPATDWLEDVMLRTAGPDVYDQWVSHQIPFNDPQVVTALDQVGTILKNDAYVNGGLGNTKSIVTTSFTAAGLPILDGSCFLHHQASFYQINWPADKKIAEDGDVFAFQLPGETNADQPVLVGGEFAAAFSDREEVRAFQAYLTSPEFSNTKAKVTGPGWISANKKLDPATLISPIDRLSYELITSDSSVLRFDASDQMPGTVGTGTFWTGMTDWISLEKSSQDVLTEIESSWPGG